MKRIDRTKAKQVFADYVENYNSADPKIQLKITHTYRVADLCEKIGASIGLLGEELDAAWMCGLLHDIGRFEQIRRYGTFSDADSIDHALLSTIILFGEENGMIRQFLVQEDWDFILKNAILYHSAYRIPDDLDEKTVMYCNILRDADKIDILKVNLDTPMEEIYNVTTEELKNSEVTPEVMEAFDEHHAVLRSLKKTAIDHAVGHISLTYELVYEESRRLIRQQGYLDKLMDFESENPVTRRQFSHIREEMNRYLDEAEDTGKKDAHKAPDAKAESFLTANYHTHTWRCLHANGTEREYIESAIRHGIRKLGFSDHIPCPFADDYVSGIRMTMEQAAEYVSCIRSLSEEYRDKITLYVGFEAEYIPAFYKEQTAMARALGCDYLIMGQHFLRSEEKGPYTGAPSTDAEFLKAYVDMVIEGMQTGSFTYLAHPDLANYVGPQEIYDREMKRLCRAMKELSIPLEINILGMGCKKHYPREHFWELVSEVGNQVILGLDAHSVANMEDVDSYRKCMQMVDKYGLHLIHDLQLKKIGK
jgi:histidinol-phosphatase (PHP family)